MVVKKVLEIQGAVGPGGSERHTLILSKGLAHLPDFEVVIVGPYSRNREMFQEIQSMHLPCYEIDLERKTASGETIKTLRNIVKRHGINVIHTHLRNADIYGIGVGQLTRIPVVTTLHGRTGPLDGNVSIKSQAMKYLHRQLLRYGARKIIAISEFMKAFSATDLHLNPDKIEVVHNCTDPARFDDVSDVGAFRRTLGVQPFEKLVSLIGGISFQKGAHHFVAIAEKLVKKQQNVKFLVAGQGDFEPEMKRQIHSLALSDYFIFAGWRPDVPKLMHATDILVMTAYQEGFGRVVTEAMAASKPVVAFASGGVPEIIRHNETGYLAPYGDVEQMTNYILALLEDEATCRQLGQKGRQRLETYFSPQNFIQRTAAILGSVIP